MVSVSSEPAENKHPGRILIVDDIPETAEFFAEQLREHFKSVTTSTPERAEHAVNQGNFSALVTDLRFVGNRRLDNGVELAKKLNGHCPPTVILTACVGARTLSIITGQAVHTDGTPLLRGVMKGSGIGPLVAQIRGAMADAERLPEGTRAAGIKKVKIPEFNSGEAPAELTNLIALLSEKLKNYVRITREKLSILKEKHGLEGWPSWKAIKVTIEGQLEQFSTFNSERLIGKGEKDTLDAMHELNSRTILLDINRLKVPEGEKNEEVMGIIRELKNAHAGIDTEIQGSFKKAENICNPELDFDRDVEKIFEEGKAHLKEIWYPSKSMRNKTILRDRGRLITTFFEGIQQHFNNEACEIDIQAIDENDIYFWEGTEKQKKLQDKIGWGGGYRINIYVNTRGVGQKYIGMTYEQVLDGIRGTLEKMLIAKRIYMDPKQFSYSVTESERGEIQIMLKTVELDREALAKKQKEAEKIQSKRIGTMMVDGGKVYVDSLKVPSGEMTLLGFYLPEKIGQTGGTWSALSYNGELIVANAGQGHFKNEEVICHYLFKRGKASLHEAYELARNALRLKVEDKKMFVDYYELTEEEKREVIAEQMEEADGDQMLEKTMEKISALLPETGIETIIADPSEFYSPSGMSWVAVEDLDDPEMQKFKQEELGEGKDEWLDVQE